MNVEYPYLPEGKEFLFVPLDDVFLQEAKKAQEELAGDTLFPVGVAIVKNGKVIGRGGNGFSCGGKEKHICPRIVLECKSGEGYDLCSLHDAEGHAEPMALQNAIENGENVEGADVYMYGHWWACEPCWKKMIDAGIERVFLLQDAHIVFSRDAVFAKTLKPRVKTAYIAGALTALPEEIAQSHRQFYVDLGSACGENGIEAYIPHIQTDPIEHPATPEIIYEKGSTLPALHDVLLADVTYPSLGTGCEIAFASVANKPIVLLSHNSSNVTKFLLGNPHVVYHVKYETYAEGVKKAMQVLKQL